MFFSIKLKNWNENKKVNIELVDASIQEILDEVLNGQNLAYDIYDRQIIIRKANNGKSVWFKQFSQNETIRGKVTDSTGAPLPGVTVVVKGTTIGIITDAEGNYSLANVPV